MNFRSTAYLAFCVRVLFGEQFVLGVRTLARERVVAILYITALRCVELYRAVLLNRRYITQFIFFGVVVGSCLVVNSFSIHPFSFYCP